MGIINHDTFTTRHGIELKDTYIAIGSESISIARTTVNPLPPPTFNPSVSTIITPSDPPTPITVFRASAIFRVYTNLAAQQSNKDFIDMIPLTVELSSPEVSSNLYSYMYSQLKIRYPNFTDVL